MIPLFSTQYRIDEATHYALWKLMFLRSGARFLTWAFLASVATGVLIGFAQQSIIDGAEPAAVGFGICSVMVGLLFLTLKGRARKVFAESAALHEEMVLKVIDDGLQIEQPSGLFRGYWKQMVRWDEDNQIFAIFLNRQQSIIVPKAQVANEIIDYMREQMKQSGLPQSWKLRK